MIEVNIIDDNQFPIEIWLNDGVHKFTLKATQELNKKLSDALQKHKQAKGE